MRMGRLQLPASTLHGGWRGRMEAGQVVLVTCVVLVLGFLSSMYIAGMVTGHSVFNEAGHTEL